MLWLIGKVSYLLNLVAKMKMNLNAVLEHGTCLRGNPHFLLSLTLGSLQKAGVWVDVNDWKLALSSWGLICSFFLATESIWFKNMSALKKKMEIPNQEVTWMIELWDKRQENLWDSEACHSLYSKTASFMFMLTFLSKRRIDSELSSVKRVANSCLKCWTN